jgi:hypothetical protein
MATAGQEALVLAPHVDGAHLHQASGFCIGRPRRCSLPLRSTQRRLRRRSRPDRQRSTDASIDAIWGLRDQHGWTGCSLSGEATRAGGCLHQALYRCYCRRQLEQQRARRRPPAAADVHRRCRSAAPGRTRRSFVSRRRGRRTIVNDAIRGGVVFRTRMDGHIIVRSDASPIQLAVVVDDA